jgi:hypothetical protein
MMFGVAAELIFHVISARAEADVRAGRLKFKSRKYILTL